MKALVNKQKEIDKKNAFDDIYDEFEKQQKLNNVCELDHDEEDCDNIDDDDLDG